MSLKAGFGEETTQETGDGGNRMIVAENVHTSGTGEYLIKGIIVSGKNMQKCSSSREYLFTGDKDKLAARELIAADSIITSSDGWALVKVYMMDGGPKMLHAGTTLGFVEPMLEIIEGKERNVGNICTIDGDDESNFIKEILAKIRISMEKSEGRSNEEINETMAIIERKADVFSKYKNDMGKTDLLAHQIKTFDNIPISMKPRRVPCGLEDDVNKMVDDLLNSDVIRPSNSPWNFPIVVVKKKNGDNRMCVDYRALNAKTARPIYPIPSSEELFDSIGDAKYFSSLDLSSGYHQVPITEKDKEKTAFSTRYGQFEFNRMPFGLCSAPATFQKLMNMVLSKENWVKCVIYLDDVLIFGRTIEEHNDRLEEVLTRIKEAGLKLAPEKCRFLQTEIHYLGHVITANGVSTDPDKINSIRYWKLPMCKKEMQTFLGFCNYYRRFIHGYAKLSENLSSMIKKENKFGWTEETKSVFYELRDRLTKAPVLALPQKDGKYILDTDASYNAIGAVLSQVQDGEEKVLYYASKSLTKSQRQYCITRKELFAIYIFVLKFKHYLIGKTFLVRTDHQALKWLLNWDSPNTSQYCIWKAELEIFDMTVEFREGKKHINADALSRLPPCEQCLISHEDPKRRRNVKIFKDVAKDSEENDKTASTYSEKVVNKITIDDEWQQKHDPVLKIVLSWLEKGEPINMEEATNEVKRYWRNKNQLRIRGDWLYLYDNDKYRYIVPQDKRMKVIWSYHKILGHVGIERTKDAVKREYYWPSMDKEIIENLGRCRPCQENKYLNGRIKAPLQNIVANEPFQILGIDITGPFRATKKRYQYILGIIDYFSKYICLIPLRTTDSETISEAIWIHWISKFGIPGIIHSDRGSNFKSTHFASYCALLGIKKTFTSPYYPQCDGLIERAFRTVKPMISAIMEDRRIDDWSTVLPIVEYGIRSTVQKTTKYSPYQILFGREPKIDLWGIANNINEMDVNTDAYMETLAKQIRTTHDIVKRNIENQNVQNQENYNRNKWNEVINVGDEVMIKNENRKRFDKKYMGPFIVQSIINKWTYLLYNKIGDKTVQRNYNQIKKIKPGRSVMSSTKNGTTIRSRMDVFKPDPIQLVHEERRYPLRLNRNPNPIYC